jgi:SAM-dependent methyltransferase
MLRRRSRSTWRTRTDPVRGREHALREEVGYWRHWLQSKGGKWSAEYSYRFDPAAEIADPALREIVAGVPQEEVSILDVGAGPVSIVGYRFPGKRIALVAVDPLADEYDVLLDAAAVAPPVRVARADGERLVEELGRDRFDVAYARNALDHAVDPARIVESMFGVVRPGGHLVLRHVRNEAVRQAYVQLHQWNFDLRDDRLVAWRPGSELDLTAMFAGRAEIRSHVEPAEDNEPFEWIVSVVRKPSHSS